MTAEATAVLGLNPGWGGFNYHDPSAALIVDGRLVAAVEEERFTRRKSAPGYFPHNAVEYCLNVGGLRFDDLHSIAIGYSPQRWRERMSIEVIAACHRYLGRPPLWISNGTPDDPFMDTDVALKTLGIAVNQLAERYELWRDDDRAAFRLRSQLSAAHVPIRFVDHHVAHVWSAYVPFGLERCVGVIVDGVGEHMSTSTWLVDHDRLELINATSAPNSLGYLYAAFTDYLGFRPWDGEGKVMALAPYGHHDHDLFRRLRRKVSIGGGRFDVTDLTNGWLSNGLMVDLDRSRAQLGALLGRRRREPQEEIDNGHRAIAYAVQQLLEEALLELVEGVIASTGVFHVCAAGGVFLNCKANMVLRESPTVRRLFVQPVAGDAGLALGAAWSVRPPAHRGPHALASLRTGPEPGESVTRRARYAGMEIAHPADLPSAVARLIADGRIVGWCCGRCEFGARALGARSILADPRRPEMRYRVNSRIKGRAPWRPFAPSILEEACADVLEGFSEDQIARYMIQAYRVRERWRDRIPAVVHPADGTTRPHAVPESDTWSYRSLLEAFYNITGVPALLNTSLNGPGEPIVRTAAEAFDLFEKTSMDALVVDDELITKR